MPEAAFVLHVGGPQLLGEVVADAGLLAAGELGAAAGVGGSFADAGVGGEGLEILRSRLDNKPDDELRIVDSELRKIAALRLAKVIEP